MTKVHHSKETELPRPRLRVRGVVLVLAVACVLFSVTVLAIQPGALSETLAMFWKDKILFPLNGFPICVVLLLAYCAFGDPFIAAGVGGLIVNLMSYVNLVKTDCRNDPFVPGDFALIREAMNAAGEYTLDLHWGVLLGILALSAACFVTTHFVRAEKPRWYVRVAGALVLLGGFCASIPVVYRKTGFYELRGNGMDKANVPEVFRLCGFPYCFLHNYDLYSVEKPEGYDAEEMEALAASARSEYTEPAVRPNVIFLMCEAYTDLSDEEVFDYAEADNPTYGFHVLASSDRARSGHIVVSNFGAGTANTEFDVLTGIQTNMLSSTANTSAFRVLRKSINALPRAYARAGYATYFMHPGYRWFYNRENVYRYFGVEELVFNEVYTDADKKGTMISDKAFLEHLTADLSTRLSTETPLFAYAVTIQNHQAYPYSKYGFEPEQPPLKTSISDESTETLSVYLEGVRDSTAMLTELCDWLDSREEPILLVFYGDHRPTLGQDYAAYRELGLSVGKTDSAESILSTYETPYLIWANEAYAPYCDFDAAELPETLSSNYLGAAVYELTGMTGLDPYFDTLAEYRRTLPVISHDCWLDVDGTLLTALDDAQSAVPDLLAQWKYYRLKDEVLFD